MSDIIAIDPHSKDHAIRSSLQTVPLGQRLLLLTYLLLTRLLPTSLILFLVRRASRKNPEEDFDRARERVAQNLPERPAGKLYWLNSIGPGDSTANQALLSHILERDPVATVLVTTRTVSAQGIFSRWKDDPRVIRQLAPHDGLKIARNFLSHWRPSVAVFCERDLWPNMLTELRRRRIPSAVVNGQLDGRLLEDFGKLQELGRWFLSHIDFIHFITDASAGLAETIMRPDTLKVLGKNLKLDCAPLPEKPDLFEQLMGAWGNNQIFTAASVATGEFRIVLDAFRQAHSINPDLRLILVPRWKAQSDDFLSASREFGFDAPRRSQDILPNDRCPVFIADSYGELGTWYGASYAAFIGDTFNEGSGHNAYEAVLKGIPIVAGGIGRLFRDDFENLVDAGIGLITPDAEALRDAILDLTSRPLDRDVEAFLSNQGMAARVTDTLMRLRVQYADGCRGHRTTTTRT